MSSPPEFVSRTIFSQGCPDDENEHNFMCSENYNKILERKGTHIRSLFTGFIPAERFEIIPSPKLFGFRQRCRFGIIRGEDGEIFFSIWEQGENTKIEGRFEVASDIMNCVMERTKGLLNRAQFAPLTIGLSAVNFHENREGTEMLLTLCTGEPLCPQFPELAGELTAALGIKAVIGRARKERLVSNNQTDRAFVTETMHIRDLSSGADASPCSLKGVRTLVYMQPEGSFSNPNGDIAELTARWLCDKMRRENMFAQQRKFVEFYCGNSNHGCYLSQFFTEVLGVEIDPELCRAAELNLRRNGIHNGVIINKPAEEVARRKKQYSFSERDFLLVDPPRAGLDELTLQLVQEFSSVIYIACDARSLARDLDEKGLGKPTE